MEFSGNEWGLLVNPQNQATNSASQLQILQREIEKCKGHYNSVLKDKDDLVRVKLEIEEVTAKYNAQIQRYQQNFEDDKLENTIQDLNFQEKLNEAEKEIEAVIKEQNTIKEKLTKLDEQKAKLERQLKVSSCMPEKKWVFALQETEENEQKVKFDVKPNIRYPIKGGCALITFDDEKVAAKILEMGHHKIEIGECSINIKAHPVKLPTVEEIEIQTQVCKHRVLISEIPKFLPADQMLDKLELHFSKHRNNGGEVENIELLEDSGNVVITFADEGISENLTKKEFHQVTFRGIEKTAILRVSPFIKGEIEHIKVGEIISKKTVLLTGIPDILDEENLKDFLQIHFQKPRNGGGEVDVIAYVPEGKSAIACFGVDNEEEI
ncbi:interferon-induced protein 35 [Pristis pectinata]|uniref:interferon-induced protein 35 n=1 Tax=Pristis pectinata TaxID=685728 RepID=UPI00223CA8A8|nr:interferon-induced protein 35 [Pristis pectinata]XP_051894609.1 interferon-induced protein 35 [Pristis pectinata]